MLLSKVPKGRSLTNSTDAVNKKYFGVRNFQVLGKTHRVNLVKQVELCAGSMRFSEQRCLRAGDRRGGPATQGATTKSYIFT